MPRKYAGPLQPGKRSAYVPGTRVNRPSFRRFAAKKVARKAFTKSVSNIIRKHQEKKLKVFNLIDGEDVPGSGIKFVSGTSGAHSGIVVSPLYLAALGTGVEQDDRIGNRVTNTYLNIRGYLKSLDYNLTSNPSYLPFEVKIIAYKNKHDRSGDFQTLKQGLGNVCETIDGTPMNSLRPFNKDEYIIKWHKTYKMNALPEAVTSSGNNIVNPEVGRNPVLRRFSLRVPIAKTLIFKDGDNTPVNDWVHIGVYVCDGTGSELATTKKRVKCTMDGYLTYTDA